MTANVFNDAVDKVKALAAIPVKGVSFQNDYVALSGPASMAVTKAVADYKYTPRSIAEKAGVRPDRVIKLIFDRHTRKLALDQERHRVERYLSALEDLAAMYNEED